MGFHYCIAFAKKASWIGRLALALHPEREARRRSGFEQRRRGGRQQQRTVSPAHPPRLQHPPRAHVRLGLVHATPALAGMVLAAILLALLLL